MARNYISEMENLRRKFGVAKTNPCLKHMHMLTRYHWLFCPWCGLKLEVKIDCPTCGMHFISMEAFTLHTQIQHMPFFVKISKEHEAAGFRHRLKWLGHRKAVYCADCRKILGERESWETWEADQEANSKKHKEAGAQWRSKNMRAVPEAVVSDNAHK